MTSAGSRAAAAAATALLVGAVATAATAPLRREWTVGATPAGPITAGPTRWILDEPGADSWRAARRRADTVVQGRVLGVLAAGPEGQLLGGSSPLPVRVWLVRRMGPPDPAAPAGHRLGVVVPDAAHVAGPADGEIRPGLVVDIALRCGTHRLAGLRICSTAGAGRGLRPAPRQEFAAEQSQVP